MRMKRAPLPINNQNCSNAAKSQTAVSTQECQVVNQVFPFVCRQQNKPKHNIMLSALLRGWLRTHLSCENGI